MYHDFNMVWYNVVRYYTCMIFSGVIWYGLICRGLVWYGIIRYHTLIGHDMIWYVILYDVIGHNVLALYSSSKTDGARSRQKTAKTQQKEESSSPSTEKRKKTQKKRKKKHFVNKKPPPSYCCTKASLFLLVLTLSYNSNASRSSWLQLRPTGEMLSMPVRNSMKVPLRRPSVPPFFFYLFFWDFIPPTAVVYDGHNGMSNGGAALVRGRGGFLGPSFLFCTLSDTNRIELKNMVHSEKCWNRCVHRIKYQNKKCGSSTRCTVFQTRRLLNYFLSLTPSLKLQSCVIWWAVETRVDASLSCVSC